MVKGPSAEGDADPLERAESEDDDDVQLSVEREHKLEREIPTSGVARASPSSCPASVAQMLHLCR